MVLVCPSSFMGSTDQRNKDAPFTYFRMRMQSKNASARIFPPKETMVTGTFQKLKILQLMITNKKWTKYVLKIFSKALKTYEVVIKSPRPEQREDGDLAQREGPLWHWGHLLSAKEGLSK